MVMMSIRYFRVNSLLKVFSASFICFLLYLVLTIKQQPEIAHRTCSYLPCKLSGLELQSSSAVLYLVTPTYTRLTQKADLVRLSQTLMHADNIIWIVVEDRSSKSVLVENLLERSRLQHVHLNVETPEIFRLRPGEKKYVQHRGVEQRNMALDWLRTSPDLRSGVVYFMDDDNTYDIELFHHMRRVRKIGIWPVALSGGNNYEGPICEKGRVTGWYSIWDTKRKFPIDMSGFAISLQLLLDFPYVYWSRKSNTGNLESDLLIALEVELRDLETLDDTCSKVLVWHTQTVKFEYIKDRMERIAKEKLQEYMNLEV